MNAPKAIAEVAAIAIVACILYATFVPALPTEDKPFEISTKDGTSTDISLDGDEVVLDLQTFVITSHMGESLEGVAMDFSIDGGTNYPLGTIDFGDIEPGASAEGKLLDPKGESPRIPMAIFMTALQADPEQGTVSLPLVAGFGFKYIEWSDDHILDMKVGVDVDVEQDGTMTVSSTDSGVEVKCQLDSGAISDLLGDALKNLEAAVAMTEAESGVKLSWFATEDGYTLTVDGTSADLEKALKENGKLTLGRDVLKGESFTLEGESAESFISMIRALEESASKEAGQ